MTCAETRAIVSVKILIEEDIVLPLRIALELLCASVYRPPPRLVAQKKFGSADC